MPRVRAVALEMVLGPVSRPVPMEVPVVPALMRTPVVPVGEGGCRQGVDVDAATREQLKTPVQVVGVPMQADAPGGWTEPPGIGVAVVVDFRALDDRLSWRPVALVLRELFRRFDQLCSDFGVVIDRLAPRVDFVAVGCQLNLVLLCECRARALEVCPGHARESFDQQGLVHHGGEKIGTFDQHLEARLRFQRKPDQH